MEAQLVTCPKCGNKFQLTKAITQEIEGSLREEFENEARKRDKAHEAALKAKDNEARETLARERAAIEKQAKKQAEANVSTEMSDLKKQNEEKDTLLSEAKKQELQLRKRVRESDEREKSLDLEVQRKVDAQVKDVWEKAAKSEADKHALKDAERNKTIEDMRTQIEELQRKAEQGSQQTQGEVLELHFEDVLRSTFPSDIIEPVKAGQRGADIIQRVRNEAGQDCGKILWEMKRAKNWQDTWVQKLADDQREAKADIAAVVSTTLPEDVDGIGRRQGIWISDLKSAKGLAVALRDSMVQLAHARNALVGKNTKMEAIYNYLSGPEFRQRVEAIVGSFVAMSNDLAAEKRAMERIWAKREKQINRVVDNTSKMYGDLQGMIGKSLPDIKTLELPQGEVDET